MSNLIESLPPGQTFRSAAIAEKKKRQASRAKIGDEWRTSFWAFAPHLKTLDEDSPDGLPRVRDFPLDWTYLHNLTEWMDGLQGPGLIDKPVRHFVTNLLLGWDLWNMCRVEGTDQLWTSGFITINEDPLGKLLARRKRAMWEHLPPGLKFELEIDKVTELKIKKGGTSRVYHAGGDGPRQEGHAFIALDELAFQPNASRNWAASVTRAQRTVGASSSNGPGTVFYRLKRGLDGVNVPVFNIRYFDHPGHDDEWLAKQRAMMLEVHYQQEILCNDEVYAEPGILSPDFSEECVVDVVPETDQFNWDGVSPIVVSIDPGTVAGAGAMIRYFNHYRQDIRLASFYRQGMLTDEFTRVVCDYAVARWPDADWLLTGDPAALQAKSIKTRFNENSDAQVISRVASQVLAACVYDENTGVLLSGSPLPFQVHRVPQGSGSRKQRHQLQLREFKLRPDDRRGTLIVRSENKEFLDGCRGAYKLMPNATPDMKEFEKPDRSMPCVHVVDADGCGLAQFVQFGGIAQVGAQAQAAKPEPKRKVSKPTGAAGGIIGRHTKHRQGIPMKELG